MKRGLDHVVLAVRDLEAAAGRFAALGFTTTPRASHPWGTGNVLVQLERSFIEILGIERPCAIAAPAPGEFGFGDFNRRFLARRQGMSMLVFSSDDAAADRARWQRQGLTTYPVFDFSRTARLPDGEDVTVAFSLAFVTHPEMPESVFFVCQQHNPEHFWKPRYQRHANGARSLDRVWLQAEEPARFANFFARLFDEAELARGNDGGLTLGLPYGSLEIATPATLAARFPGAALPALDTGPAFAAVTVSVPAAGGRAVKCESVGGLLVELRGSTG